MQSYSDFVAALASTERHTDKVPLRLFRLVVGQALADRDSLDGLKKALFAGKPHRYLDTVRDDYRMLPQPGDYAGVDMDLLNGVLGARTEADELLSVLYDATDSKPVGREKVIDEAGDLLFYLVLALNAVGSNLDEAIRGNVAKLRVRFPEGWDSRRAAGPKDREAEARAQQAIH